MTKSNEREINLLRVLAEGCNKHPAYRARRPATGNCQRCVVVWSARLELNNISGEQESTVHEYWHSIFPSR
ncbi:MAG: hypothetical protein CMF69_09785 [Magnetovibrio sp.]|nr:hypothetical protein [Magnetovibrio sp.]